MVAQVRRETRAVEVPVATLNRPKHGTKRHQAVKNAIGNWTRRVVLSGFVLLSWCLLNALILTEAKTHNWQKQQISLKEMQVYRLQTAIAHRLSDLTRSSFRTSQPMVSPVLLGFQQPKRESILLGRR